ncbi:MAG: glycosyltransferase family 4 protein [Candidatus Poribacteria bacterium]
MIKKKLKRICYYEAYSRNLHGAQKILLLLISRLDKKEFDPVIVCPDEGKFTEQIAKLSFPYFIFSLPKCLNLYERKILKYNLWKKLFLLPGFLQYTYQLCNFLNKNKVEIVHCNNLRSALLIGPSAKLCRIPLIWHLRIDEPFGIYQDIGFYLSNCIISAANALKETFSQNKRRHKKIITVYDGVDSEIFSPQVDGNKVRVEFCLGKNGEMTICMISSLTPRKGHIYLIKAAQKLIKQGYRFKILIVGGTSSYDDDNLYYEQLKQLISENKLNDYIIFTGRREDVSEILSASDIFVLPSLSEGFPISILEAMSAGLPVVATDVAGTAELVEDGITGILVPPKDPEAISKSLAKLLLDVNLAKKMGERGRERVKNFFSVERMVSEIENIYKRCLDR